MRNFSILEGNDDPKYPKLELCFGGRRKFVGGSYVDFGKNFGWEKTKKESPDVFCKKRVLRNLKFTGKHSKRGSGIYITYLSI